MGLLAILFNDASDTEFKLAQDLVAIAMAAFVKAMSNATDLLMENSLLSNEFRMMGIDFETVLMDEREQAIRRWINPFHLLQTASR